MRGEGLRLRGGLLGALRTVSGLVLSLQLFICQKIARVVDLRHHHWDYLGSDDLN